MGDLTLRLDKENLGSDVNLGVVARVLQIKDSEGNFPKSPFSRELVIPAGESSFRGIDGVPGGTYRIEARMPSGEILSEERDVADDQVVEIVLKPDSSPHEWLSWQRFAGNVPSQNQYEDWLNKLAGDLSATASRKLGTTVSFAIEPGLIAKTAGILHDLHLSTRSILQRLMAAVGNAGDGTAMAEDLPQEFAVLQFDPAAGGESWAKVGSLAAWQAWGAKGSPSQKCAVERKDDRDLTLWRIQQNRAACMIARASGPPVPLRSYVQSRRGTGVDLITIPAPWPLDPGFAAAPIEVLREAGTSTVGRTSVTVCDNSMGGLLTYLNNGRLSEASAVLAAAEAQGVVELISDKQVNPLAACAAAYVGLATLANGDHPRWGPWLANLKTWFDWLPDGAVVHAAYLLKTARTRAQLDDARDSLKTAYRRGVPFYAAGVQSLMQGLYMFSAKDAEAKTMHEQVRQIAQRVDPSQAFTVITLPGPADTADV